MSKLSKRDSALLIIFGVIAVVGGMFWFYVKPAKADLKAKQQASLDAQDRVDQLQSELTKLTAQAKKPRTVAIVDELRLAKAYPYSEDVPELILQIEDIAKQIRSRLVMPHPPRGPTTPVSPARRSPSRSRASTSTSRTSCTACTTASSSMARAGCGSRDGCSRSRKRI